MLMNNQSNNLPLQDCPPIILASTSPRRQELLAMLQVPFQVIAPTVDESQYDHLMSDPKQYVELLARLKGESVAKHYPNHLVIGSDTTVYLEKDGLEKSGEKITPPKITLGKPTSPQEAEAMLGQLQNNTHTVFSAIAVSYQGQTQTASLATQVRFCPMSPAEIKAYVDTGEPMDKAGAYAIQGIGGQYIHSITGCYFNVMGMSVRLLRELFAAFGFHLTH
jgi:septum formation protein